MKPTLDAICWLTAGGSDHRRPVPMPDGAGFLHEIATPEADDGRRVLLATDPQGRAGALLDEPAGLRDLRFVQGALLVATWPRGGGTCLGTLDLDSGKTHALIEHPNRALGAPCASIQTGRVVFHGDVSRDGSAPCALAAPFGGGSVEKLTERSGQVELRPVWSPDGKRVALEVLAKPGAPESAIALFDLPRRRTEILVMEPGVRCSHPDFLDDRHLVFARATADGRRELVVLDVRRKQVAPIAFDHPAVEPRAFRAKGGGLHLVLAAQQGVRGAKAQRGAPYDVATASLSGI